MKHTLLLLLAAAAMQAAPINFAGQFGATATVDNQSLVGNQLTFTLFNTSASGTITALGFDLPGSFANTFVLDSASVGTFTIDHDLNTIAGAVTNEATFDVVLRTGPTFGGGSVADGIGAGLNSTIQVTGPFGALSADQIVQSLSLRFQGIGRYDKSTVAEPTENPIPEPTTSALLGSGLLALGLIARRRRGSK
jgi:hypothetical protein